MYRQIGIYDFFTHSLLLGNHTAKLGTQVQKTEIKQLNYFHQIHDMGDIYIRYAQIDTQLWYHNIR